MLLALRNVFRHRGRSLVTLAAIALGCTSILFVNGFFEDLIQKMRDGYIYALTGHLQVYRRGFYERGSSRPFDYLIERPDSVQKLIAAIPHVKFAAARLAFPALISDGENSSGVLAQGVEPSRELTMKTSGSEGRLRSRRSPESIGASIILEGEALRPGDSSGVILGQGLAAGLAAKVGDTLVLLTHTVSGSTNAVDLTVRGIFQTSAKEFDDRALRLPIEAARSLLSTEDAQSIIVVLDDMGQTVHVADELRRVFAREHLDLEVKEWGELTDAYAKTRSLLLRFFDVVRMIVAVVVILSVVNTMNMAVMERTTEIGTIMALGTRPGRVTALFLLEGMILGVLGGTGGIMLGMAVVRLVASVGIEMPPPPGTTIRWLSEPQIVPSAIPQVFLLAVLVSSFASMWPAAKAGRLEITEALRNQR